MNASVTVETEHCGIIILALVELAKQRPGWEHLLIEIASKFPSGKETYDAFAVIDANAVLESMSKLGRPIANNSGRGMFQ